jgi:hypothetical protein
MIISFASSPRRLKECGMCSPTFAIQAASAGLGFAAEMGDYKAQKAAWKQNYINALAAGRDEQQQLLTRQMQESDAFSQKQHLSMIEQAQAQSTARVAAQASGTGGGGGIDVILRDIEGQAAYNRGIQEQNYANMVDQLAMERKGAASRMKDRINSMPAPRKPGIAGALLKVAGAGVTAYKEM